MRRAYKGKSGIAEALAAHAWRLLLPEAAWDGKKTFRLGASLPEANKVWDERLQTVDQAKTVAVLLDRYALEVIPKKKITTQAQNNVAIKPVRATFGSMALLDIKPRHVYEYINRREEKTSARREMELLSHALTKAAEWGYLDRHSFKGEVRLEGEKARTRYVEDWEIVECLSLVPRRKLGSVLAAQTYIRLKLLTEIRRGDILRLTMSDLRDDGIYIEPGKTRGHGWKTDDHRMVGRAMRSRRHGKSSAAGGAVTVPVLHAAGQMLLQRERPGRQMGVAVEELHDARDGRNQGGGTFHRTRPTDEMGRVTPQPWSTRASCWLTPTARLRSGSTDAGPR